MESDHEPERTEEPEVPESPKPRQLPADLPTSLDDRRPTSFDQGVEVYDAWQGQSQFLTSGLHSKPLDFNLALDDPTYDPEYQPRQSDDEKKRLSKMLAAQAAHRQDGAQEADENEIVKDVSMSDSAKREILQKALHMAASNGDLERLDRLISGEAKTFIDLNGLDEEGTAPLIYASCFGHDEVVEKLLQAGAEIDKQDRHQWTALMWATANKHTNIVKTLLDLGASPDVQSSSGRTAFDFVAPQSDISDFLNENGYKIGSAGIGEDFYNSGLSQDRFEEEMAETEMKRRMMMESAINLEVDLGNLGLDEQPESPEELEEGQEFVWDRCLNDQMFVFQENELGRILDVIITHMTPQRSPSQKPVPANILFLSARYAHYHANADLLETLLVTAMDKINDVVERCQWDMTILAFWMSNATLLLHYLKKDTGLVAVTADFQLHISELINEIFVLIIRDAERRMDRVLDAAMLDHETIPGFEDIHFQNEWNIFKSKSKAAPQEPPEKRFRPPSPKRRAQISPRNITSLLSSTLFVLDLYDIHSVITTQVLSQLLYWLGAELFNRIMSNRKYLARTKAMQIRMNVSVLEDWARANNRHPEHYEDGSMTTTGDATIDAARHHLAPVVQLLQWLQIFSSGGDTPEALNGTIKQLPRLSPQQLIHAVKYYRAEVGEKGLPKTAMKYLQTLQKEFEERKSKRKSLAAPTTPSRQTSEGEIASQGAATSPGPAPPDEQVDEDEVPENLLMDPALMLPFSLPTSTDMLISYGAGLGGVNRERALKYIPTVPPEFLAKLDMNADRKRTIYGDESFDEQD